MISKNYLNILVEQLFLHFLILHQQLPEILDLYLNDYELFVETLSAFPASVTVDSSPLKSHKLLDVSE